MKTISNIRFSVLLESLILNHEGNEIIVFNYKDALHEISFCGQKQDGYKVVYSDSCFFNGTKWVKFLPSPGQIKIMQSIIDGEVEKLNTPCVLSEPFGHSKDPYDFYGVSPMMFI